MKRKYPKVHNDRRRTITPEQENAMYALRKAGLTYQAIADRVNCSLWAAYSRVALNSPYLLMRQAEYQKIWKKEKSKDAKWKQKYQDGKNKFSLRRYATEEDYRLYVISVATSKKQPAAICN